MVSSLVESLLACPLVSDVLVTINIPENITLPLDDRVIVIHNSELKGFSENHNIAFKKSSQPFFCVLNPDIQLQGDPFAALIKLMTETKSALVAPLVLEPTGRVEDNFRRFPSLRSLFIKAFGGHNGSYAVGVGDPVFCPDWAAGMFMLFNSLDFKRLKGFDERFYLYYEDVDICARIWKMNMKVMACPNVAVIHVARRHSHSDLRYMRWHLMSMMRYLWIHRGELPGP
jgi:N-acetylglucosaminyl-diphospho-decaprenol L-rhamnosyltransferase